MQQNLMVIERLRSVVRAYDIRGLVPNSLSGEEAYLLGVVLIQSLRDQCDVFQVVLGMDNRSSSDDLKSSLICGLMSEGAVILDLGLVPTPLLYHAALTNSTTTLGIMITASHNPPAYNGFKIIWQNTILDGQTLLQFIDNYAKTIMHKPNVYLAKYLNWILDESNILKVNVIGQPKVLWDCNYGVTQEIVAKICQLLPQIQSEIIGVGTTIEQDPDPGKKERIDEVIRELRSRNLDLALSFDGDGDRLLVTTRTGKILRGDRILLLCAAYFQTDWFKSKIVVDIKTSPIIVQHLTQLGYQVSIEKTGHSFIKKAMIEQNARIGGEVSGHLFFLCNNYPYDDALLAALLVLKIYIQDREIFYSLLESLPTFPALYDIKIPYAEALDLSLISKLAHTTQDSLLMRIDGVKSINQDGAWLIRKSNTEPAIIICIEGYSKQAFLKKILEVKKILLKLGLTEELVKVIDNEIDFDNF